MTRTLISRALFAGIVLLAVLPLFALAQSSADLRATIRQSLLSDPRTHMMTEPELDAMVDLLAAGAEEEGMSASDITWRPQAEDIAHTEEESSCTLVPRFLCTLNRAFGFDGSAVLIPILLGITSMVLIVFFGYELERHYMRLRAGKGMGAAGLPPTPPLA